MEITTALAAVRDADVALVTTTEGRTAAEASYRARVDLYQAGRATLVELADAETEFGRSAPEFINTFKSLAGRQGFELLRARVEAVNAHVDARLAVVRLARATGRDVAAVSTTP
jgi:outer membrane protein TolC